jgi:hypothetical protein
METLKLIRIPQLIRKQEDIANMRDTVFTITGCNENRTQFSSCTSYGKSLWARFSRCVPTTGVCYKRWYLLVLAASWQSCTCTSTMLVTCPTVDTCETSPSTHNCALLRSHETFKRQDF